MTKKVLLWIEDNPSRSHRELIQSTVIKRGLALEIVKGVSSLQRILENFSKTEDVIIHGVILDLMIHGADSLADFGYPEVSWNSPADVGEYLLQYVFRNIQPKQQALAQLQLHEKPILILTVKSETREEDFLVHGKSIELAHKYDLSGVDLDKQIRDWINKI